MVINAGEHGRDHEATAGMSPTGLRAYQRLGSTGKTIGAMALQRHDGSTQRLDVQGHGQVPTLESIGAPVLFELLRKAMQDSDERIYTSSQRHCIQIGVVHQRLERSTWVDQLVGGGVLDY